MLEEAPGGAMAAGARPPRPDTRTQGRGRREEAAAQARPEVTVTTRSETLLSIAFVAIVPGVPLVAAKLALLLAFACVTGRLLATVVDWLIGPDLSDL